jgi:hypothetical protein
VADNVVLLPTQNVLLPEIETTGKGVTLTEMMLEYFTVQDASFSFALNWVACVRLEKVLPFGVVVHPLSEVVEQFEVHCCQVTAPELPLMLKVPLPPEQTLVVPAMVPGRVL